MLRPILLAAARAVVSEGEAIVHVSLTEWHTYRFDWLTSEVHFFVDGEPIYTAQTSPRGPLGFVAWFDNSQVDVETDPPTFGRLVFSERQWFELGEVTVEPLQALG
ncbi:MAG: family 16 glycosylhydrolase [Chloroflexi bacterium]|nr:family 16 glycosylhydrolase [Chloroflexota bacterium]